MPTARRGGTSRGIDGLCGDPRSLVYVAGRLFDIEEKVKSEYLEGAVLSGIRDAAARASLEAPVRACTYVPFRDANQESLDAEDKTRRLYEADMERLGRAVLLVSYVDGLAKDEGVCFEIGAATALGVPSILVSTDFFSIATRGGVSGPLDPLMGLLATRLIREPRLPIEHNTFLMSLLKARETVLTEVTAAVSDVLRAGVGATPTGKIGRDPWISTDSPRLYLDMGGELFEWQQRLADEIEGAVCGRYAIRRPMRFKREAFRTQVDWHEAARTDLSVLSWADLVVVCSDAEECPTSAALALGLATGLGIKTGLYNSKVTSIEGPGGYCSSRNLMLDYSATWRADSLDELVARLINA